jgi:hypothetical protein
MADTLEHEIFSRYLNTTFRISLDDSNTLEAKLDTVSDRRLSPQQQERFELVFRGPREPLINQGSYRFQHDEMGDFTLFIVPVAQNNDGTLYEACFNRMLKREQ